MRRGVRLLAVLFVLMFSASVRAAPLPQVPDGFRIEPVITQVHHPTRLAWGPDGRLYIAQQTGEVIAVTLEAGKELARDQVAQARLHLLGIILKGDQLWVSETGTIAVYTRTANGHYESRKEIVTAIPHGLHQNDGLAWGPDGKLYWGLGSTTDRGPEKHPWSGTIMRMDPEGTGLEVYAKGFRNPYGITFGPDGKLWITDNGADQPVSSDELNLVVKDGDYGFPTSFGVPPAGSPTKAPVALFGEHNSTNGLAFYMDPRFPARYRGGVFVAMWGSSFDDQIGRSVGFVVLEPQGDTYQGKVSVFATGFDRPLDLIAGPGGDLWVADFVAGVVYRIWWDGPAEPLPPGTVEQSLGMAPSLTWVTGTLLVGAGLVFWLALWLRRRRHHRDR